MPKSLENRRLTIDFSIATFFLILMWFVKIYEVTFNHSLYECGILPRHLTGLCGILLAPLIHGDWQHLYTNSFPFLILFTSLLFLHPRNGMKIFWIIWFAGNIIVWLIGRSSYHIGASGVIFGIFAYLLFYGIISRRRHDLAISLIVIFLYGGLIWGIIPQDSHISWEAHLGGFSTGAILALIYAPKPQFISYKRYVFTDWKYNFDNFETFRFKTNFYYIYAENNNYENTRFIQIDWSYTADNSGVFTFVSTTSAFREI